LLQLRTTQSGVPARDAFLPGDCAFVFSSIADHATVGKLATEGFNWEVAMIPHYANFPRHNTVVSGVSN
jgi:sn-glycerol 3-phosphate transport system substrate-binding protein